MKRINFFALCLLLLTGSQLALGQAPPMPQHLNYQGRVTVQGVNFNGTGQFKFALVDQGTTFGLQATATAVVENGAVVAVNVDTLGNNYTAPPTITFGGPGTGATATATLDLGVITMITVTNGGSGYTTAPTVTISAPPTQVIHTTLWSNDGTTGVDADPTAFVSVQVTNGNYTVALGDTALGMAPFYQPIYYTQLSLRVWFNDGVHGFQRLLPDQKLAAAPYALRARLAEQALLADTVPDGSIGSTQLANGAVTSSKLASGAITSSALAAGAVTSSSLAAGAVTNSSLAPGAITSSKIAEGSIDATKLAPNAALDIVRLGSAGSNVVISSDASSPTLAAAGYVKIGSQNFATESWAQVSLPSTPAPVIPNAQTFHLDGEMYVFGGSVARRFDPVGRTWQAIPFTGIDVNPVLPGDGMVWTGTELIFCDAVIGYTQGYGWLLTPVYYPIYGGVAFNPTTATWRRMNDAGSPNFANRHGYSTVWTGSRVIVWGGRATSRDSNNDVTGMNIADGAIYDPQTDSWSPLTGGPVGRMYHSAVWSGIEMIIWGGVDFAGVAANPQFVPQSSGYAYNPSTGNWRTLPALNAPSARYWHQAVMTAPLGKMLILGGSAGASGAAYDTLFDSWSAVSSAGFPQGRVAAGVSWTGSSLYWTGGTDDFDEPRIGGNGNIISPATIYFPPKAYLANPAGGSAQRYDLGANNWTNIESPNARTNALDPAPVWTGSELLVYGADTPGRVTAYSPATNWRLLPDAGVATRQGAASVFTGNTVLYWGGQNDQGDLRSGGAFHLPSNTFTLLPLLNSPSARNGHTAVWTGTEMIIWGGRAGSTGDNCFQDGAKFNPATNVWTPLTTSGAPAARYGHTAVWTGSEMLIWGGSGTGNTLLSSGARYNPATNTWQPLGTGGSPPSARNAHSAIWTGTEMMIWGGVGSGGAENTGASYSRSNDSWTLISSAGAPSSRSLHTAVWTGSEMLVWGGVDATLTGLNTGARYNPAADSWQPLTTLGAPTGRHSHRAVWSGSEMILWGGTSALFSAAGLNTGARYSIATDTWTPLTSTNVPPGRYSHVAEWTGTSLFVLFGRNATSTYLNDAHRYTPPASIHYYIKATQ